MPRVRNTTFVSIAITFQEKARVDAEARRQGIPRNRLFRNWIATLPEEGTEDDVPTSG